MVFITKCLISLLFNGKLPFSGCAYSLYFFSLNNKIWKIYSMWTTSYFSISVWDYDSRLSADKWKIHFTRYSNCSLLTAILFEISGLLTRFYSFHLDVYQALSCKCWTYPSLHSESFVDGISLTFNWLMGGGMTDTWVTYILWIVRIGEKSWFCARWHLKSGSHPGVSGLFKKYIDRFQGNLRTSWNCTQFYVCLGFGRRWGARKEGV